MYAHEEDTRATSHGETKTNTTEAYVCENLWEEAALQQKAKTAWASKFRVKVDAVNIEDIRAHDLGIKGWASLAAELAKPGPSKGVPKGKAAAKSGLRSLARGKSDASGSRKRQKRLRGFKQTTTVCIRFGQHLYLQQPKQFYAYAFRLVAGQVGKQHE